MRPALAAATSIAALVAITTHASDRARVDNFMLLDHQGAAHELYYYADAPAVVLIVQGNGCPIVRNALADYRTVSDAYAPKGVEFFMLNANLQDGRTTIAEEAREWGIPYRILVDETQLVAESLGLTRTAEVLVIDPRTWQVAYRGPVNDRLSYERQKQAASEHYLSDALDAMLDGTTVAVASRDAMGCLINLPGANADHASISYSETIAPMLQENCVACHQTGGIAPWAMTDYNMVRGFAPMIREVIRTKRMPPWHADPHIGQWQDDRSLAIDERQALVHWIEAGAPRGEGPDPLAEAPTEAPAWPLGEPDLIVRVPAFDVPATGIVDYQFPVVANPLDRDVWVRAMSVKPGSVEVVHHVLVGTTDVGAEARYSGEALMRNYLGGYAPGIQPHVMPDGTGVYLPKGTGFMVQMHYTPYGKPVTDETEIGLYFHDEPPANFLRHSVVLSPTIRIPPNAPAHEESAYFEFKRDAILYSILPHSHYRGRSSTFELVHPGGRRETILSVPNYDFNWQRGYDFVEPREIAAGTRLIHRTVYDNSSRNPGNPDPTRTVVWGLQSHEEMLYGDFMFSWVDERSDAPVHDHEHTEAVQWVGYTDRDMSGGVSMDEIPERMRERFVQAFDTGDENADGELSADEYYAVQRDMKERRQEQPDSAGE
ncbi:MAG: redoxin domain-containing protein [Gammaproteobacteria bacterium]|nr:redoxin domain-containing protein [Gammaproteobacteria bacterium]